jgi:hypothetical protein
VRNLSLHEWPHPAPHMRAHSSRLCPTRQQT